jgi:hypothetical protein
VQRKYRHASPLEPVPYAGGGVPQQYAFDTDGGFEHNAIRPVGRDAPRGDDRYRKGELLLMTEEDFGPTPNDARWACRDRGMFTIASLKGSLNGEAWKSTPQNKFRLQIVGSWNPYQKEGSRPPDGPFNPLANFCSAHYFDIQGSVLAYAWYGEGTRFLDISNPASPRQIAYWRPANGIVWASYFHEGYVYTADRTRGVDILKLKPTASASSLREVVAPPMSRKQQKFLRGLSSQLVADEATAGLCYLPVS